MKNLQQPPQLGMDGLAELEMGMDAAWASKARKRGNSGASVLLDALLDAACWTRFLPAGRWLIAGAGLRPWRSLCMCPALRSMPIAGFGLKPGPSAIVHPGKAERPQLVYSLYHFELGFQIAYCCTDDLSMH